MREANRDLLSGDNSVPHSPEKIQASPALERRFGIVTARSASMFRQHSISPKRRSCLPIRFGAGIQPPGRE
jgi:hypothetical protein